MPIFTSALSQRHFDESRPVTSGSINVENGVVVVADGNTPRVNKLRKLVSKKKAPAVLIAITDEGARPSSASPRTVSGKGEQRAKLSGEYVQRTGGQAGESLVEVARGWTNAQMPMPVFIDVSCLSRPAIGEFFASLRTAVRFCNISLHIAYGLAKFSPPPTDWAIPNKKIEPIHPYFCGWTDSPRLPLSVVVGLGYERGKALGALEYLEPGKRYVFAPESSEAEYRAKMQEHNKEILEGSCFQFDYDVLDPVRTYLRLASLASGLEGSERMLLLPFGPKIFLANCLMLALSNPSVAVWHVAGEMNERNATRTPSTHSVVMSALLSNDNLPALHDHS